VNSPSLTPGATNFWLDQARERQAAEAKKPRLSQDEELEAYRNMLLIRRFEEKAGQLYGMGFIGGFCHLYIGQEAVVTGMMMTKREGDQVITAYRDHGHMLSTGMDPKGVMAELTGRRSGYSKGKGGSMHMFSVEKKFYGGHGIVGTPAPLGSGIAFANKYRGNDHVCLTFFGEGAANQGQVYESFNMASLWKLPVVFIIENNHYAMGTAVERATAQAEELYREHVMYFFKKCLHVPPYYMETPGYRTKRSTEFILKTNSPAELAAAAAARDDWSSLVEGGFVIAGSPETVTERLVEACRGLRVGNLVALLQIGSMPHDLTVRNITMFAEQVMPTLQTLWDDEGWTHRWWPQGARQEAVTPVAGQ